VIWSPAVTGELHGTSLGGDLELVPYDPAWPARFEALRDKLALALGPVALRIDHIGSTAVPSLAAKAVIDIQVIVSNQADDASYMPGLESTGLGLRYRDPAASWSFFRPMRPPRTHHVHVTSAGSPRERAQLLFVDYLRYDAGARDAYAALKYELAATHANDRVAYTDAKTEFVTAVLEDAEAWAATTGWQVPRATRADT